MQTMCKCDQLDQVKNVRKSKYTKEILSISIILFIAQFSMQRNEEKKIWEMSSLADKNLNSSFFPLSLLLYRSLSADYFGFQPYYDQHYMEPIDVPGK